MGSAGIRGDWQEPPGRSPRTGLNIKGNKTAAGRSDRRDFPHVMMMMMIKIEAKAEAMYL